MAEYADIIKEEGIEITDLPQNIQSKIEEYETEEDTETPDAAKLTALDEEIQELLVTYIDELEPDEEETTEDDDEDDEDEEKEEDEEEVKPAPDVVNTSTYPTAVKPVEPAPAPEKKKGLFDTLFGQ